MANPGFLQPVAPVINETTSNVTATPSVGVGMLASDAAGNNYIYVYNTSNSQISQGQFAVLATNVSGMSVTITNVAAGMDLAIGVARNATLTTGTYGWLMTRGFTGISTDAASGVTGQVLALGSLGNFQVLTSAAGSFVTAPPVGRLQTSVATGVTIAAQAYINLA